MTQTLILSFLAGLLGANATPHFVKGITKEQFPTPFSASPLVNLIAGWAGYVLTAFLLLWAHVNHHPLAAVLSAALGVLPIGIFHAHIGAFGKRPTPAE
jgi:hypothetical protein